MPFMVTERWLMLAVQAGGDRQMLHEVIRRHARAAADGEARGEANDLLAAPRGRPGIRRHRAAAAERGAASRRAMSGAPRDRWRSSSSEFLDPLLDPGSRRGDARRRRRGADLMRAATIAVPALPLPLWRRGKVREVYEVGRDRLLIVASDRVSAFDVIMAEPVPDKGRVLTQLSAFWFRQLDAVTPSHFLTALTDEIIAEIPALAAYRAGIAGRAMLVRRSDAGGVRVRGAGLPRGIGVEQSTGAAARWRANGFPKDCSTRRGSSRRSSRRPPRRTRGHDENVPFQRMRDALGARIADDLRERSLALYRAGSTRSRRARHHHRRHQVRIRLSTTRGLPS